MGLNNINTYGVSPENTLWSNFRAQIEKHKDSTRRRTSNSTNMLPPSYSLDAIMQEFRLNGLDSPYDPEDSASQNSIDDLGPSSPYIRQLSWPAPDATPCQALPRAHHTPPNQSYLDIISEEQLKVLSSLPNNILYSLLRELELNRGEMKMNNNKKQEEMECRFCKNNGERPSYYKSHKLRSRGRLCCPVLRAYRCRRCGAHGDRAHTITYCPLASADERMKSAAMMRSVRLSRRPSCPEYVMFGDVPGNELDPIWEALERKLML